MPNKNFSHSALASYIRKLNLKPGNALVVTNLEVAKQFQMTITPGMNFNIPVFPMQNPDWVSTITRAELLEMIFQIDEAQAATEGIA